MLCFCCSSTNLRIRSGEETCCVNYFGSSFFSPFLYIYIYFCLASFMHETLDIVDGIFSKLMQTLNKTLSVVRLSISRLVSIMFSPSNNGPLHHDFIVEVYL